PASPRIRSRAWLALAVAVFSPPLFSLPASGQTASSAERSRAKPGESRNATQVAANVPAPSDVAKRVDAAIREASAEAKVDIAERTSDEDFLRRITFDLAGALPAPEEITLFG